MKERKKLPFMSGWSEAEQEFAHVIIEIVERKYKDLRTKSNKKVQLENIKIELDILTSDYVNVMQGFDPSNTPEKTAKRMLGNFQTKEEIKKYSDGFYCLNKKGDLYNHLVETRKSNRKRRSTPYMVAGGDSEGKVTYTYPTGNSEDY